MGRPATIYAAMHGHLAALKVLLNDGIWTSPLMTDFSGRIPISFAAECEHLHVVKFLLDAMFVKKFIGASYLGRCDNDGLKSIDYARRNGHTDIVNNLEKFLAESGLSP